MLAKYGIIILQTIRIDVQKIRVLRLGCGGAFLEFFSQPPP